MTERRTSKKKGSATMDQLLAERTTRYKKHDAPGEVVQISARISRKDWLKMAELRAREGLSHQEQVLFGLGLLFERFDMEPPELPPKGS